MLTGFISGVLGFIFFKIVEKYLPQRITSEWWRFVIAFLMTMIAAVIVTLVIKWWRS